MKLFDGFEAVRFPEENLIFVTHNSYLDYIYHPQNKVWVKYQHAGNDKINVGAYQDVSVEEIKEAMGGIFPDKSTDFVRLCCLETISACDMIDLLKEDYPAYMADDEISYAASMFIKQSDIKTNSYLKLKELFDKNLKTQETNERVLKLVKKLCFDIIGRDIYKREICIIDGHDTGSCFWIRPVRVIDYSNTDDWDHIAAMNSVEISIDESDVDQYLTPFLYKYYDDDLEANRKRQDMYWIDEDGKEHISYKRGFQWYLTDNFYTLDSVENIIADIQKTINALSAGRYCTYLSTVERKWVTYEQYLEKCGKKQSDDMQLHVDEISENSPVNEHHKYEVIIDFYRRFVYRMDYMIKIGKEKGYDYISFCGP